MAPLSARLLALTTQNLILALLFNIVRKRQTCRRRSVYTRRLLLRRPQYGEWHLLVPEQRLYDQVSFRQTYRMSPDAFQALLEKVGPRLQRPSNHINPIGVDERLSATIKFLATGQEQIHLANTFRIGRSTLNRIINETCAAIWDILQPEVLRAPGRDDWLNYASEFQDKWNFPHCLGAIDGKHVVIQAPKLSGSNYFNYKNQHSIVLLAVCDAEYRFTMVDIGSPGRNSDAGIFAKSPMGKAMEADLLNLPPPSNVDGYLLPYVFVGDEAFPLKSYLIRPFPGREMRIDAQEQEQLYKAICNYRICRARRIIENTFGIWSCQWRIFRRPIIAEPHNVTMYMQATVCLHNWLRQHDRQYCPAGYVDRERPDGSIDEGTWRRDCDDTRALRPVGRIGSNNYAKEANGMRKTFMEYFSSPAGSVTWQIDRVLRGITN